MSTPSSPEVEIAVILDASNSSVANDSRDFHRLSSAEHHIIGEELEQTRCSNWAQWWLREEHFFVGVKIASTILFSLGVLFVILGAVLVAASSDVVEQKIRYDDVCSSGSCVVNATIAKDMSSPVYLYYRLVGFAHNQRRYVGSRSVMQLYNDLSYDVGDCSPIESNSTGFDYYPCGLSAYTFFNDEYSLSVDDTTVSGLTSDIAWDSDIGEKFIDRDLLDTETDKIDREGEDLTLPSVEDPAFVNWMRTAAFQTFRKLSLKFETDIAAGSEVSIRIEDNFNIGNFEDIEKYVVLSTVSWAGGKNVFLGVLYLVSAVVFMISGVSVALVEKKQK